MSTNYPSSDRLHYGLPYTHNIKQSILPVVSMPSGRCFGFFYISETDFDGTERTYALSEGPVEITTVTSPAMNIHGGSPGIGGVQGGTAMQFMAAVYTDELLSSPLQRPWMGYSSFVYAGDSGYADLWSMPTHTIVQRLTLGNLLASLTVNLTIMEAATPVPPPPPGTDATLQWTAAVSDIALASVCPFFDFNWILLFHTSMEQQGHTAKALRLVIKDVPTGFQAFLVQTPTVVADSNSVFDTVRIVAKAEIPSGDYEFDFEIENENGITPVTLTLTVTAS